MRYLTMSPRSGVCFILIVHSGGATFQKLNDHVWSVATVSDSTALESVSGSICSIIDQC